MVRGWALVSIFQVVWSPWESIVAATWAELAVIVVTARPETVGGFGSVMKASEVAG